MISNHRYSDPITWHKRSAGYVFVTQCSSVLIAGDRNLFSVFSFWSRMDSRLTAA